MFITLVLLLIPQEPALVTDTVNWNEHPLPVQRAEPDLRTPHPSFTPVGPTSLQVPLYCAFPCGAVKLFSLCQPEHVGLARLKDF